MSEEKARNQAMKFRDVASILRVLDTAYDLGIRTFMCTTHDRIADVCEYMRARPDRYGEFKFYPGMPYAHKYANAVTELGILGAVKKYIPGSFLGTLFTGGKALATKDFIAMMKLMVDAEMKMFEGLNTEVIFLQNVVTDLLLGLELKDVFKSYADHIRNRYRAEPAFFTMNLPRLLDLLEECGIENPIICSSVNKIGFRMCGGIELYEKTIRERKFRPVAMSIFASGAIAPREAVEYICNQEKIESIVFGASSKSHIQETKELIESMSSRNP